MMIQPLKWDTAFFKLKIGKINGAENLKQISKEDSKDFDLIYIEQPNSKGIPVEKSGWLNVEYIDKKTIYRKELNGSINLAANIKPYPLKSANKQLQELAIQSGAFSRFRLDRNFGEDDYKRLYAQWVRNSVRRLNADMVLIYGNVKNPAGFITLAFKEHMVQIGLIAVDEAHQYRGVGKALVSAAEYFALKNKFTTLQVVTQSGNISACAFYEKIGFKEDAVTYTYHHWNKEC